MNGAMKLVVPLFAAVAITACNANSGSPTLPGTTGITNPQLHRLQRMSLAEALRSPVFPACPGSLPDHAYCDVLIHTGVTGNVAGLTPHNLQVAYDLPSKTKGTGQTVAIVDAYDEVAAATDLARYRRHFGLGKATFAKYNQLGQKKNYPPPAPPSTWGVEIDLDLDMVSAICPKCKIILVEGNSDSFGDLGTAEKEAVKLGAHIVSNSYGGSCSGSCSPYGGDYDTAGVEYLAASGDGGYNGDQAPAQFDTVVSVGGSILTPSTNSRGWDEIAWPGTGGGCSSETKPAWQHDPGCTFRTGNDVAAVAVDVAEYDSVAGGWIIVNGTSVATPLLAGVFALAGNASSQTGGKTFWMKTHEKSSDLYHITSGSDGSCSSPYTYLCTDGTHQYRDYGGPTGWGTPHGIGAF